MKVLLVNRHLYRGGGDAAYTLSLARLLRERGHEVIGFGLESPRNDPDLRAPVLMEPFDFPGMLERRGIAAGIAVLRRTIWSGEARARMKHVLDLERPDIVHLQNIHHHLTPSLIEPAVSRGVPVVWTLHDFTVICPNGNLFSRDRICEECRPARFHRAVVNRCKRGSLAASLVAAVESAAHRALKVFDGVDLFVSPSRFLQAKLSEFGFRPGRVVHLDGFVAAAPAAPLRPDPAARSPMIYAGRLLPDKGIATLLEAAARWGDVPLVIAGDGPMRERVEGAARNNPLVRYVGQLDEQGVGRLLESSLAAVVPSIVYENQPIAVLEAFRAGRPVIAAAHGGLPELVGREERGLLFTPGDPDALAGAVRRLAADAAGARRMGEAARRLARERFTPARHYQGLMAVYGRALGREVGSAA